MPQNSSESLTEAQGRPMSPLGLAFSYVGLRYLARKRLSYLAMLGVGLSVGTLIVVMSVMSGFEQQLRKVVRGYHSDVTVRAMGSGLYGLSEEDQKLVSRIAFETEGVRAVAPFIQGPGLMRFTDSKYVDQVFFRGIDPALEWDVSEFGREFLTNAVTSADPQQSAATETPCLDRVYTDENGAQVPFCMIGSVMASHSPFEAIKNLYFQLAPEVRAVAILEGLKSTGPPSQMLREIDRAIAILSAPSAEPDPARNRRILEALHGLERAYRDAGQASGPLQECISLIEDGLPEMEKQRIEERLRDIRLAKDAEEARRILGEMAVAESARYGGAANILLTHSDDLLHYELALFTMSEGLQRRLGKFRVADTFQTRRYDYDANVVLIPLDAAEKLVDSKGGVSGVNIRLDDYGKAPEVVKMLRGKLGPLFLVQTWEEQERNFLEAVHMEIFLMAVILSVVGVLAGFCIFAILSMTVYEKRRDIGILKAVGFTPGAIAMVFLFDGGTIGVCGAAFGALVGRLFVAYINEVAAFVKGLTGWTPFPQDVYYFTEIPRNMAWSIPAVMAVAAVLCSLAFSVIPALKAARMDPVETLRFE